MITIIHVGKSGGSSLRALLRKNKITHEAIHMEHTVNGISNKTIGKTRVLKASNNNILLMRDPVNRILSVYNFWLDRVQNNIKHMEKNRPNYIKFIRKYNNINDFFENLYEDKDVLKAMNSIDHMRESLSFYIEDKSVVNNIKSVIRTEHLNEDIKEIFNLDNDVHRNETKHLSKDVSDKAIQNIKKFCTKDYEVIEWLLEANLIDKEYINKFK